MAARAAGATEIKTAGLGPICQVSEGEKWSMASPQIENGFTKLANEILEQVIQFKFNGTQYKIIMLLWRYTYGFNRLAHEMSNSFIEKATGANAKTVKKELGKLLEDLVITEVAAATFTSGRVLAFNKNYAEWKTERTIDHQGANNGGGGQLTTTPPIDHQGANEPGGEGANRPPGEGANRPPKKEILNKDLNTVIDNNNEDQPATKENAFNFYCNNFGMPSPFISQSITEWVNDFSEEIVLEAMQRAIKANKARWGYAESILKAWAQRKVKSLADIEALDTEHQNNQQQWQQKRQGGNYKTSKPIRKEVLPNWFDDHETEQRKAEERRKKEEEKQNEPAYVAARKLGIYIKLGRGTEEIIREFNKDFGGIYTITAEQIEEIKSSGNSIEPIFLQQDIDKMLAALD